MRKACLQMVYELAKKDPRVVFIGSDVGHGTLDELKQEMPERYFMEGISEANVVGMAAGMALDGKVVYVNTIAPFFTRRALDQLVVDLCMHKAKVRLIANGGGMVYAPLGPTHEVTEDIAVLRSIPNMTIISVADAEEMKRMMECTLDWPGPIYIRLAKGYDPLVTKPEYGFEIGKAVSVREGEDALLVTTGITLAMAIEASNILQQKGVSTGILHIPTIKPFDAQRLLEQVSKVKAVVTMEEHSILGGLGGQVAETILEANLPTPPRYKRIGLPDVFPQKYGSQIQLLNFYGVTAAEAVSAVESLVS